ncbi:MAG: hypothetical protein ACXWP0_04395 [Ktedonobacterales bacterium]
MQNYHTSPFTAILAAIREADPQRGVTARQIAEATGLSIVHTVVPALHGYKRGGIIRYVPSPDMEIHVAMADGTRSLVDVDDPQQLEAHLIDAGDVPAPQQDGYYYLYKRNHRGGWDLTEESDAAVAVTYRAYGYQDTTADDFQAKWLENGNRWQA